MEKLISSLIGYAASFIISTLIWGKYEGDVGFINNLRFEFMGREIALHHWMLFLLLAVILVTFRQKLNISDKLFYLLLGFFMGGLNQGLTFKDWYKILK
ncbi:hypothetical protein A3A76_01865 [Candidatus Woesebacteria bacterium RIFCSPLOWO2_01_FULL_39_23]|uniref:Uncharacterized protein n=1 Tax=Candidatus Woesebacteria bacterium RIFCSPHIGHO2_01_FULL_40_22 TaxID=1802499 RepID=A0A1F7YGB6_9BACT|nr:MAG: hypothetical protein A2141_05285 [Candidatus Woesebacteria bacterium RBG_16_40_11]OGM26343.1 MAG: hypothetical protein A2628_03210 [Candidatus Woesebacteria bacterium RIFCSPHIGHO2_01_FULL_40_22]OGM37593.1 MAG: hypothetical protein A3E41_05185 [Candidatus Woesebacteria bacterium RIFCSPHIGHO2_12_FULL_38_9]OGM61886.1 MAG: hypothetical protein A3A76_01865 [Candidatus Woesebacteria bacterium RIFCSPLOWO2_01_FULL_39_23]